MFERAVYKDSTKHDYAHVKDSVGFRKYDGASFFLQFDSDGSPRFYSRRQSVKGHFPERTEQLPQLTQKKLPEHAGEVFNVELIHTGFDPKAKESHSMVSGILNSLPARSIQTQKDTGPVRAVIHNMIEPGLKTYAEKLVRMKQLEDNFGNKDLMFVPEPHFGLPAITKLVDKTKKEGLEGAVVLSLTEDESKNPRYKVKHQDHFNLIVVDIIQEVDIHGKLKPSMGALVVADKTGRIVAKVGTGFTAAMRKDAWENKNKWLGRLIQVRTMGLARHMLRMPVYNGDADGDLDTVE